MNSRFSNFGWASLLLGIIAVVAAMAAFRDPAANLLALTVFFGFIALIRGVLQIYSRFALRDIPGANMLLLIGIVNVVLGVLLLTDLWVGLVVLPTLFAIWFIAESILGLMTAGVSRALGSGYYWFRIVICILGIFVGVGLLNNPAAATVTIAYMVGFYFMLLAINCFVEAFGGGDSPVRGDIPAPLP